MLSKVLGVDTSGCWGVLETVPPSALSFSSPGRTYLCSPNLESIEARWLRFKHNYSQAFRGRVLRNEISNLPVKLVNTPLLADPLSPSLA